MRGPAGFPAPAELRLLIRMRFAKSKVVHSTTIGGKYVNAKAVKVNKSNHQIISFVITSEISYTMNKSIADFFRIPLSVRNLLDQGSYNEKDGILC